MRILTQIAIAAALLAVAATPLAFAAGGSGGGASMSSPSATREDPRSLARGIPLLRR